MNYSLPALRIELRTLLTERLIARPLPKVLRLDVVASIAVGIVMVNRLLNRVPRCLSHFVYLHYGLVWTSARFFNH